MEQLCVTSVNSQLNTVMQQVSSVWVSHGAKTPLSGWKVLDLLDPPFKVSITMLLAPTKHNAVCWHVQCRQVLSRSDGMQHLLKLTMPTFFLKTRYLSWDKEIIESWSPAKRLFLASLQFGLCADRNGGCRGSVAFISGSTGSTRSQQKHNPFIKWAFMSESTADRERTLTATSQMAHLPLPWEKVQS